MNNENLPDSALYYDPVHPNQNGYEKLGKEILRVMRDSVPGVIPEINIEN
jgi:lysophospholipase L1-like esterase